MSWLMEPVSDAILLLVGVWLYMLLQLLIQAFLPQQKFLSLLFFMLFLLYLIAPVLEAFLLMKQLLTIFSAFFLALIPLVSTILVVLQSVLTFIAWTPMIIFLLQMLIHICETWLLPSIMVALVLDLCSRLYPDISFLRLADLIRKSIFSIIAAAILVLSSVLTISGFSWFVLNDTVTSPIKKVIEQNVPIIGSLLVQGMSLLKTFQATATTFVGLSSVMLMLALAFTPAVLLLIKAFTLKLAGAITEPFMDKAISQLLDDLGHTLFLLCGIALLLSICFIVIWILLFVIVQIGTGKLL